MRQVPVETIAQARPDVNRPHVSYLSYEEAVWALQAKRLAPEPISAAPEIEAAVRAACDARLGRLTREEFEQLARRLKERTARATA